MNPHEQALEDFERNKRKLSEDSDGLVRESPPSKRAAMPSSQDATISGVLSPPMSPTVTFSGSNMVSELDKKCSGEISEISILAHLPPPFSMDLGFAEPVTSQISPSLPADVGQPQFKK
jgi:hypothetical protein